jgi:hypothetical protein
MRLFELLHWLILAPELKARYHKNSESINDVLIHFTALFSSDELSDIQQSFKHICAVKLVECGEQSII